MVVWRNLTHEDTYITCTADIYNEGTHTHTDTHTHTWKNLAKEDTYIT